MEAPQSMLSSFGVDSKKLKQLCYSETLAELLPDADVERTYHPRS